MIASTRYGLEAVVKKELIRLGFNKLKVSDGKLEIEAAIEDIPRLNLWLRCADRIFLKQGEFMAVTFDELFEQTKAIPWERIIIPDGKFVVKGSSVKSELKSVKSCQSLIKKAIVDRLREQYCVESLHETGPMFSIHFTILKNCVTLGIDTSGTGLHKRGYRQAAGEAPLKETLAAGLVALSDWQHKHNEKMLIDPLCGSGTILIEAALQARNVAPGLRRSFAAEDWPLINSCLWQTTRQEAVDLINHEPDLQIYGYDIDKNQIAIGIENATLAGVENDIVFQHKEIHNLWIDRQFGTVITNPPYGIRMAELQEVNSIYRTINKMFKKKWGWSLFILTADKMFPNYFKRSKPDRVRKLYNGNIKVNYYQYLATRKPSS